VFPESWSNRYRVDVRLIWQLLVFVTSASCLIGCALDAPKLPITYLPQQGVRPIKDADAVFVEVKVEDLQPEAFNYFAASTMHYQVKDAADTVKDAAETELKSRGFKIGNGGALVTIQLIRLEGDVENAAFGPMPTAHGNLFMQVQVSLQTGKVLYSQQIGGEGTPRSGVFMWHPVTHELEQSLSDAFKRLFADPAFTAAILATRPVVPAKPVQSKP
jgi:Uncharacterized lipoprotein